MNVERFLDRLRRHGVAVRVSGGQIRLMPGSRVPSHLVTLLHDNKAAVRSYIFTNSTSFGAATQDCRPLELWRRLTIPEWRDRLKQSVDSGDKNQEEYARWMLLDILLDPEYQEPR